MTIPYARALVEKIPPVAVRLRRDVGSLLPLSWSHAVLHQATRQKDKDRLASSPTWTTMPWSGSWLPMSWPRVSAPRCPETVRETVDAVAAIATPAGIELRSLADRLNLDKSNVSRRARASGGRRRPQPGRQEGQARTMGHRRPVPDSGLLPDPANSATPNSALTRTVAVLRLVPTERSECDVAGRWTDCANFKLPSLLQWLRAGRRGGGVTATKSEMPSDYERRAIELLEYWETHVDSSSPGALRRLVAIGYRRIQAVQYGGQLDPSRRRWIRVLSFWMVWARPWATSRWPIARAAARRGPAGIPESVRPEAWTFRSFRPSS